MKLSNRQNQSLATPPTHPDAVEAREFARTFDPRENVDYAWVSRYAVTAWNATNQAADLMMTKAEKLIGFSTTVAGIAAAGIVKAGSESTWPVALAAVPSLICWLVAVTLALRIHQPENHSDLPGVDNALQFADHFSADPKLAEGAFCAKLHQSREYLRVLCEERGSIMQQAYNWVRAGLWSVLLPIAIAIVMGLFPGSTEFGLGRAALPKPSLAATRSPSESVSAPRSGGPQSVRAPRRPAAAR